MFGPRPEIGQSWVEIEGRRYGAWGDARGPIGGGAGYGEVVSGGDVRVGTLDELIAALAGARAGEVINRTRTGRHGQPLGRAGPAICRDCTRGDRGCPEAGSQPS